MGAPHPVSRKLELHNTWLVSYEFLVHLLITDSWKANGLKHYVDWAATEGFGVIDINIPKHLAGGEVCIPQKLNILVT